MNSHQHTHQESKLTQYMIWINAEGESHKVQLADVGVSFPTSECWHMFQRSPKTPELLQILSDTGPKEVRDVQ